MQLRSRQAISSHPAVQAAAAAASTATAAGVERCGDHHGARCLCECPTRYCRYWKHHISQQVKRHSQIPCKSHAAHWCCLMHREQVQCAAWCVRRKLTLQDRSWVLCTLMEGNRPWNRVASSAMGSPPAAKLFKTTRGAAAQVVSGWEGRGDAAATSRMRA